MNVPPKLQVEITALLQEVQQQGQFHHLILTDDSGMLVAAAGQADWEAETLAAMVGTVWRWVDRIHQRLGLAAS
ncbi:MAG TPA: roadblock/LC7 domain-containing protein, partial [Chloroflexi bacterium]|nr:roadblock/LC7 domain-containing protein [Chloroflexota bacterium]